MIQHILRHARSNVVGYVAVFLSLTGSATAVTVVGLGPGVRVLTEPTVLLKRRSHKVMFETDKMKLIAAARKRARRSSSARSTRARNPQG
jgi:hypothetical protein